MWTGLVKVYTNIKWFFTEIMNIYSSRESYFSKKRIESGTAFAIAQWGMISYFRNRLAATPQMTIQELCLWAGVEFAVAGYVIKQIQNEKKFSQNIDDSNQITDSNQTTDLIDNTTPSGPTAPTQ